MTIGNTICHFLFKHRIHNSIFDVGRVVIHASHLTRASVNSTPLADYRY